MVWTVPARGYLLQVSLHVSNGETVLNPFLALNSLIYRELIRIGRRGELVSNVLRFEAFMLLQPQRDWRVKAHFA